MPFAACQSNGLTVHPNASSISSCLIIVLSVLCLSDPFLDLRDLLLVAGMVGLLVRVMQP